MFIERYISQVHHVSINSKCYNWNLQHRSAPCKWQPLSDLQEREMEIDKHTGTPQRQQILDTTRFGEHAEDLFNDVQQWRETAACRAPSDTLTTPAVPIVYACYLNVGLGVHAQTRALGARFHTKAKRSARMRCALSHARMHMHTTDSPLQPQRKSLSTSDLRSFDKEKWQDDFLPTLRQEVRGLLGNSSVAAEVRNGGAVRYSVSDTPPKKKNGGPADAKSPNGGPADAGDREAGERERTGFSAGSTKCIGKASRAKVSYLTSVWPLFFGPTLFTARG